MTDFAQYKCVIDYCFQTLGVEKINGACIEENAASMRVMEKAGLCRERIELDINPTTGEGTYARYYGITRARWQLHKKEEPLDRINMASGGRVKMTKQDQDRRDDVERQINQLLHEGNYLPAGRDLCLITLHQHQTSEGHVYSIGVEKNTFLIPEKLILKVARRNHREIYFYQSVKKQQLPVQPCLAAEIDPDSGYTALLSADLSNTHSRLSDWDTQPPDPVLQRVVEMVAQIHAFGWQQRQIGNLAVDLPSIYSSQNEHDEFVGWLKRDADGYIHARQNRLPAKVVEMYTQAIQQLRAKWEQTWSWRIENNEHLSLVHGDLHPGNIFYPVDKKGSVCCIDWEAFRLDLPTTDLVMLLALHLAPHAAQALPLLKAYHAALLRNGISNYPFQNLLNDYRSAILYGMFVPMKLFAFSLIEDETMIEHVLTACESFHCLESE